MGAWLPFDSAPFTGSFPDCGLTVAVENNTLVIRNWDAAYPMRLEFVSDVAGPPREVTFRMHMLGPYLEEPGTGTTPMWRFSLLQILLKSVALCSNLLHCVQQLHFVRLRSTLFNSSLCSTLCSSPLHFALPCSTVFHSSLTLFYFSSPHAMALGCFTFTEGGENACPTSCMMRMGRSDNNFVSFIVKPGDTKASTLKSEGLSTTCVRTV